MNIVGCVLHFSRTRPSAPALVQGGRAMSYGELADRASRTAAYLAARGVRRGERVGLLLRDTIDHLVALLGVALMGAVPVTLDWRARANETARFIDALDLALLLTESDAAPTAPDRATPLDEVWRRDAAGSLPGESFATDWHDPFIISGSSGSTGAPKFTLMTHRQYFFAVTGMLELLALAGRHRFLCTLPLYYSGGRNSCIAHLLRGDCVVLYPNLHGPGEYLDVVARERITVATLVPTAIRALLTLGGEGPLLPDLAALHSTGAPLHADEKRQAVQRLTPNFHERYGTAETLAISILHPADFAQRPDSVGQPHSLVEVQVADEGGASLRDGTAGLLRIRGPGVATPLAGPPAQPHFRDGWFYPGEIARLDEAGYIFLEGRTSDVIVRSGAKFYPAEIEAVLLAHAAILEAAVIGHRGGDNEEGAIAFVVPRTSVSAGQLLAHCRAMLTPHKVPRQFLLLAELPKNAAGKVDKLALAARLDSAAAC